MRRAIGPENVVEGSAKTNVESYEINEDLKLPEYIKMQRIKNVTYDMYVS